MHELSVCMALLEKVEELAEAHGAAEVERISLKVGPLSGVEPSLLRNAFPLAAAGTVAESAVLDVETTGVRVSCETCGAETEVEPSRLICGHCGGFRTRLVSGDEMLLAHLDLRIPESGNGG